MAGRIDARLAELGVTLPDAPAPAANYVPFVQSGNLVFISGQISQNADGLIVGKVGADMSTEDAQQAARTCALSIIAQARAACGDNLNRIKRFVKVTGFVNGAPDFTQHPEVINGASDTIGEIFVEAGAHARAAVGCGSLPRGVAVEVEAVIEIV